MPLLRGWLEAASRLGMETARAIDRANIASSWLQQADRRVPRSAFYALASELATSCREPAVGLQLAQKAQPGDFEVLDYAIRNSPTLGDAYRRIARYSHILHNGVDIFVEDHGDRVALRYCEPSQSPRHIAEWAIATWLVVGRQATGVDWSPLEIEFQHPAPDDLSSHRRLFRCPITFAATDNALWVESDLLATPLTAADPRLSEVLGRYADDLLAALPKSDKLSATVKREVARELRGGDPNLEVIAKRLGMAPRTLQRRLRGEETSFRDIVDQLRRELAHKYLRNETIAIDEIAFLLGFSEASAFHRAFKKWEACTPHEYRLRNQSPS